jgi:hypothetical protein
MQHHHELGAPTTEFVESHRCDWFPDTLEFAPYNRRLRF